MIHVNPATMSTLWASNTSGFVVAADRSELLRQIGRRAAERLFFCRNDVRRALMELLEKHFPGAARTWRAPPGICKHHGTGRNHGWTIFLWANGRSLGCSLTAGLPKSSSQLSTIWLFNSSPWKDPPCY